MDSNTEQSLDDLAMEIIHQENLGQVRMYSELPVILKDPSQTHPGQIRRKDQGIELSRDENRLYGAMQGMFNAKLDFGDTIFRKFPATFSIESRPWCPFE